MFIWSSTPGAKLPILRIYQAIEIIKATLYVKALMLSYIKADPRSSRSLHSFLGHFYQSLWKNLKISSIKIGIIIKIMADRARESLRCLQAGNQV